MKPLFFNYLCKTKNMKATKKQLQEELQEAKQILINLKDQGDCLNIWREDAEQCELLIEEIENELMYNF